MVGCCSQPELATASQLRKLSHVTTISGRSDCTDQKPGWNVIMKIEIELVVQGNNNRKERYILLR